MKRGARRGALILLMALVTAAAVYAQGGYAVAWWKVAGGGGDSQGSAYTLSGTAGQAEPGALAGGQYTLAGGFWHAAYSASVYLPLLSR